MYDSRAEIDLDRIAHNAKTITERYSDYKYFIGILKSDGYGHGMRVVNELEKTASIILPSPPLTRQRELRRFNADVPVLLLEPVDISRIGEAEELNLTLPIHELCYAKELLSLKRKRGLNATFRSTAVLTASELRIKTSFLRFTRC